MNSSNIRTSKKVTGFESDGWSGCIWTCSLRVLQIDACRETGDSKLDVGMGVPVSL